MAADVDWNEGETRARRRDLLAAPLVLIALAGLFGLTGRVAFWEGRAGWLALAIYAGAFAAILLCTRFRPRLRAKQSDAYRLRYAVAHHLDPGPHLRERADALVRRQGAVSWFRWWFYLAIPLGPLMTARWDRPLVTVPSALVVVAATLVAALAVRRWQRNARRWAASPPGPPREIGPPIGWERWLTGRRAGAILALLALVPVVAIAVAVTLR